MVHIGNRWDEILKNEFESEYYKSIRDFIFSVSLSDKGLYMLKTIALPIPSSANERMSKIFENSPLIPRYSEPKVLIKTVRLKKLKNIPTIWHIKPIVALRATLSVLDFDILFLHHFM